MATPSIGLPPMPPGIREQQAPSRSMLLSSVMPQGQPEQPMAEGGGDPTSGLLAGMDQIAQIMGPMITTAKATAPQIVPILAQMVNMGALAQRTLKEGLEQRGDGGASPAALEPPDGPSTMIPGGGAR